jgi:hypothetical protein
MRETWEEAVLRIVRSREAPTSVQEVCAAMDGHPLVQPHHKELWGGQPNLDHWVRSALARLKRRGAIRHVGRALYNSN